jgi:hypothetical protein
MAPRETPQFRRFGLISRIHAVIILTLAAILITSLILVTIGLHRHPSQRNLIGFVFAVLVDFSGLYLLLRVWLRFVLAGSRPPSNPAQ